MDKSSADSGGPALAETLVAVTGVTKRLGNRLAVENLSLSLNTAEVCGIVGANGGGKTTTLRILAGILRPEQGEGQVLGFDLRRETGKIRCQVGYMPQRLSLYGDLSVFENLRFRAEVYGLDRARAAAGAAIVEYELGEYARTPARELSGGWARRLQLAAALMHSPRLLLLDEPTAGLDAVSRHDVWRRVGHLAAQGAGVIVSTHDMVEAERCSSCVIVSNGRVVAAGTPEQVAAIAPAAAFMVYGAAARLLAPAFETVAGVIASYPHGSSLRVVAEAQAQPDLCRLAGAHCVSLERVPMRLDDASLVFSRRDLRSCT